MNLVIKWPPAELNPNSRTHWSTKGRIAAAYRQYCYDVAKQQPAMEIAPGLDIVVRTTFSPPDRRNRDVDNMLASFKSGLDGIAEALGVNDSRFRIHIEKDLPIKHGMIQVEVIQ